MDKKASEKRATERLKQLYPDFPKGAVEYGEEPDVRVRDGSSCTGIEITEYFRPEMQVGSPLQEQESLAHLVVNRSAALYLPSEAPILAAVTFAKDVRITKRDVEPLAQALVRTAHRGARSATRHVSNDGTLPNAIVAVAIYPLDRAQATAFIALGSTWPPEVDREEVQRIITSKEQKLQRYKKECAEVWLVIVLNGFRVASMTSSPMNLDMAFGSSFARVLILQDDHAIVRIA